MNRWFAGCDIERNTQFRARSAALLVVGLAHVGLLALLVLETRLRRSHAAPVAAMTLVFFNEPRPVEAGQITTTPQPVIRNARHSRTEVDPSSGPITVPAAPPDARQNEPPDRPPVDWSEEARRASDATLARQEKDSAQRSFDFPKVAAVPPTQRRDHAFGDTDHYEGGETIEWLDGRCYVTNRPTADVAAENGPGPSIARAQVCKHR